MTHNHCESGQNTLYLQHTSVNHRFSAKLPMNSQSNITVPTLLVFLLFLLVIPRLGLATENETGTLRITDIPTACSNAYELNAFHCGTAEIAFTQTGALDGTGIIEIAGLEPGFYDAVLRIDNYLGVGFSNILIGIDVSTEVSTTFSAGDLDGDNAINLVDFSMFSSAVDSETGVNGSADLNCDGSVDIQDFSIFSSNFGKEGVSVPADIRPDEVSDVDGNVYNTVLIGEQLWMAENLRTTRYNDGDDIVFLASGFAQPNTAVYSWLDNDITTANDFGALYNWYAAASDKLCPCGWRVPSDTDWEALRTFLDPDAGVNTDVAGGAMKDTAIWNEPNTGATNGSGFTGLPTGFRNAGGTFLFFGERGYWWSATENSTNFAWSRALQYNSTSVPRTNSGKSFSFSVRCLKN